MKSLLTQIVSKGTSGGATSPHIIEHDWQSYSIPHYHQSRRRTGIFHLNIPDLLKLAAILQGGFCFVANWYDSLVVVVVQLEQCSIRFGQ
jgi:hypothetical protein